MWHVRPTAIDLHTRNECAMTQHPQTVPAAAQPARMNWRRMLRVWTLLAASMTAAALACWAALPRGGPTPEPADVMKELADLQALVWPKDMAPTAGWQYIVVHHSATPSATLAAIDQWHYDKGFDGVGYHFMINNGRAPGTADGKITPTARWLEQRGGAHAKVPNHPDFNAQGIGVCLIGNFEQEPPTPAQMASLETLVEVLRQRYGITLDRIVGHGELKNTKCPGKQFPMEALLMALRQNAISRRLAAPAEPE